MPGICGIVTSELEAADPSVVLLAMCRGLTYEAWTSSCNQIEPREGVALGSVRLNHIPQGDRFYWDRESGSGIVVHGELYERPVTAGDSNSDDKLSSTRADAKLILDGYLQEGPAFLRRLNGSFSAAIWSGLRRELALITDRFASRPLYFLHSPHSIRFASGVAALLAASEAKYRVNPRGLAQFFTYGHYLQNDTALADVSVVPAGACFIYRADTRSLVCNQYYTLSEPLIDPPADRAQWLERIDAALLQAVRRRTATTPHLGIALSGGLDARTILGLIDVRENPLQAICYGMQGSLDHRASAELARLIGCSFHAHVLGAGFLGNFRQHLERMVSLTDGQYLSQCIVIPTLPIYRELGIQTLLRGHAGELMHMRKAYNYSLDDVALQISTEAELRTWMTNHLRSFMLDGVAKPLFTRPYQEGLTELADQSIDEDLAAVAAVEQPLQRIWHLFVSQRLRRETTLSMLKFGTVVEPRLPYLDNDLVPLLLAAPTDLKVGEEIQSRILAKHRPEFLRVVNSNTGTYVGAARWRQRLATLRMKVFAKLGVPGYQPYERLGLWLRRELAPVVRSILLDSRTLDRGVFAADGVRDVIHRHIEEGHNHTFLLMALMIFELGLRKLLDAEADPQFGDDVRSRALIA